MRKTIVYIDGFNLYYALKRHNSKWLDIGKLCERLLTENEIVAIKYFTARVSSRIGDLDIHVRQDAYIRALLTNPKVEIIYGHFLTNDVWMVKSSDKGKAPGEIHKVRVIKTEEKGSDVNIASHLLLDGFQGKYDVAAVLTNDSDLKVPVGMVKRVLRKTIGVICPHEKPSQQLIREATFFKTIKPSTFRECLLPEKIVDGGRAIHCPRSWL